MSKYNPQKIEAKWQRLWEKKRAYASGNFIKKKKKYVLVEFPYPSGAGLHVGHLRPYVAGDVSSRYFRAKGFNVMFPFGFDAFGLPAENYAIKIGVQPQVSIARNIKNARKQVVSWGMGFDWQRQINTTDPDYYKWTQWIFLQFYYAGLAYEAVSPINWCPKDKTGLANEEVINGRCERCGALVEKKDMRQWFLKITAYAQKLLDGLAGLDWPEPIKIQQQNWIGKSDGAEIDFSIWPGRPEIQDGNKHRDNHGSQRQDNKINVFTTRAETLFGATYLVLAPEHPLVHKLCFEAQSFGSQSKDGRFQIQNIGEVQDYIRQTAGKSDLQRVNIVQDQSGQESKTGIQIKGIYAINPATGKKISVWLADYVVESYGTGAIMAVPGHDTRDSQFARKFKLPISHVIDQNGRLINSGKYNGLSADQARIAIVKKFGKLKTAYKLRDWVFSRQRYWGEPIPMIHCTKCGVVPVPEKDLPVVLPKVKKYQPTGTGQSPLAAVEKWVNVKCPKCGGPGQRETNTMPNWAGSSWYFLRYCDPRNRRQFASARNLKHWMPVDLYFGGMEHTTLHLLYSRFWNLFLYDRGLVPVKEPYARRQPHGIVLGPDGEKMSKSRGNVVNPNEIVKKFGADTLRMYQLFLGPHEQTVAWSDAGIVGVRRFLDRSWNLVMAFGAADKRAMAKYARAFQSAAKTNQAVDLDLEINTLLKRLGDDIESFKFNTAVSAFMEFLNRAEQALAQGQKIPKDLLKRFLVVLSPFAPHISEQLWHEIGGKGLVVNQAWPKIDAGKLVSARLTFVVQVNGKVRGNLELPKGSSQNEVAKRAHDLPNVKNAIAGQAIKKTIFLPDRLINFVI